MATSMVSYLRRNSKKKSNHHFIWRSLWQTLVHTKEWRRSPLAVPHCHSNIKYVSTSKTFINNKPQESDQMRDKPIAYSESPAQNHKVADTFQYDPQKLSSIRPLVLCFGLLSGLIYFGFIRNETESEKKIFDWRETEGKSTSVLSQKRTSKSAESGIADEKGSN